MKKRKNKIKTKKKKVSAPAKGGGSKITKVGRLRYLRLPTCDNYRGLVIHCLPSAYIN